MKKLIDALLAVIILAAMCACGRVGTPAVKASATPAPTAVATSAPTSTGTTAYDPEKTWNTLAGCNISVALMRVKDGKMVDGKNVYDESVPGYVYKDGTYERWVEIIFDPANVPFAKGEKLSDRFKNPIRATFSGPKLRDLEDSDLYLYNKWGFVGELDYGTLDMYGGFCTDPTKHLPAWSAPEDLKPVGTFTTYSDFWGQTTAYFYVGHKLSEDELYSYSYQLQRLDMGLSWQGLGDIGQSNSSEGYEVKLAGNDQVALLWWMPYYFEKPRTDIPTGIKLPLYTEIVVFTSGRGTFHTWQRFVLVPGTASEYTEGVDMWELTWGGYKCPPGLYGRTLLDLRCE